MSREGLEDAIAVIASHVYAGTCRWLELVGELDARMGGEDLGGLECGQWLAWCCGLAPRTAREYVRVARTLRELPLIRQAFSSGELSYAKVRALTRVAEGHSEGELLELAGALTAAQLERTARAYRRVGLREARDLQEREYVTSWFDDDGSFVIRGRLAPEDGALVEKALEVARERLWREQDAQADGCGSAEPRRLTKAEALVAVADMSLAAGEAKRTGGDRFQVVVHVDSDALAGGETGGCELDEGPALCPETVRRVACDSAVVKQGPSSVGRKTRSVPPAIRRALRRRDRGCRFPGCERRRFVDAHHVKHWADGGETSVDNLLLLCRRHHRAVHEGGYRVERGRGGDLRFLGPWGGPLADVPRPPPGSLGRLQDDNGGRGVTIDARTCHSGWNDPLDLELAVHAMLVAASRDGGDG